MYAIVQNGSHQYRVWPGQFLRMEKLDITPGELWKCGQVLAFQDKEGQFITGLPYIERAEVRARVIRHGKSKKVLVFKKKRRKGYRKTQGHRQRFTEIYIESLITPSGEKIEQLKKFSFGKVSIENVKNEQTDKSEPEKIKAHQRQEEK